MRILFAVLEWGLGHATRDTPLIEGLLNEGHEVDILSTGRALKFLKVRFGKKCKYFDVPSVRAPYTKSKFFGLGVIFYLPRMGFDYARATILSRKIIARGKYDRVISDGRYDVCDKKNNSYIIAHRLNVEMFPGKDRLSQIWFNITTRRYISIVPDFPGHELSGPLSIVPKALRNETFHFIGGLSHVKKRNLKKDIDYFISISGPEPQRTIFEEKVMSQLHKLKGKIAIALGNPDSDVVVKEKNLEIHSLLGSKEQEKMFNRAKFIITRSGYTTMMELGELEITKALLIPTPGQMEQERLADFYEEKKIFHHVDQYSLDLKKDVDKAKGFHGFKLPWKTEETVRKFVEIIEH